MSLHTIPSHPALHSVRPGFVRIGETLAGEPLDLALADLVTEKVAFIGRSGSGKSYACGVVIEGMLDAGAQVLIVDVAGVWWGLQAGADGGPGIPIAVLGGAHGDLPLTPESGALVADLVVDRNISAVLDILDFTLGEQQKFLVAFMERFFHRKKTHRSPVHLVLEEAQEIVPQNPKRVERLLGIMQRIAKVGRASGVGMTLITQRPQAVSKEVLNQTEVLFVGQTSGKRDRDALRDWIVEVDDGEWGSGPGLGASLGTTKARTDLIQELPGLQRGTMFVWSPQWLRRFEKIKIGTKRTADVSATPKFGLGGGSDTSFGVGATGRLAKTDLEAIKVSMAALLAEEAEKDPTALQKRIKVLEARLASGGGSLGAMEPTVLDLPVVLEKDLGELRALVDGARRLPGEFETLLVRARVASAGAQAICDRLDTILAGATALSESTVQGRVKRSHGYRAPEVGEPAVVAKPPKASSRLGLSKNLGAPIPAFASAARGGTDFGKCELAILNVLGTRRPHPTSAAQVSILAGYRQSGGFNGALASLREAGLISGPGKAMHITDEGGRRYPGTFMSLPNGPALLHYWQAKLGAQEGKILGALVAARSAGLTVDRLAEITGYQQSGGFNGALAKLRKLELICRGSPAVAAATFYSAERGQS